MAAKVTIDGDARSILDELSKMQKAQAAANKEFRTAATESKQLDAIARRALASTRTEAEKFTAEMEDLGRAFKAGKLDLETYNRSVKQLKDSYREAGRSSDEAFGSAGLDRLTQFAAGVISVSAVLGTVKEAFRAVREEQERLAELFNQASKSSGALGQIARSPEDARNLRRLADQLFASGATEDLSEANRVVFAARSTGQESDLGLFRQLGQAELVTDLATTINTLDSLKDAFGKLDVASNTELTSQLLELSKSTQVGFEEVGQAASQIGSIARQAGFDFEQAGAAIGVISDEQGGVERARTRIGGFFREGQRAGLFTGDLVNDVRAIQARIDEGESLDDLIGKSSEAQEGFFALSNRLADLKTVIDSARASTDTIGKAIENNISDAPIVSRVSRRAAEAAQALQERPGAVEANIRAKLDADIERLQSEVGQEAIIRTTDRWRRSLFDLTPIDVRGQQLRAIEDQARISDNQAVLEGVALARQQVAELRRLNAKQPAVVTPVEAGPQ